MNTLWQFLFEFWAALPWVFIALMAALAFRKTPDNRYLMLQTLGAAGMFVLAIAQFLVNFLLAWLNAPSSARTATAYIFGFLLFLSLTLFAIGYCLERFKRRNGAPIQVTATPVD
jgi:hypothetical protein